ncbi:MAG: glycerophosphodiester phosphodiesterase family protein, partial [Xanthobacteraceae bacterium]
MAGLDWLIERPIAHRGLHGNGIVENTLGAAAAAVAANYGIEVDLQLTADSEVVVFHDTALDRLTTGKGPLAALPLAELKKLTFPAGPERIPTLQELLDTVAGRTPLVLELKSEWNGDLRLVECVAKVLTGYAGPVAAMSFDPELVVALQTQAPGLPRGIVAERYYDDPEWKTLSWKRKFTLGNLLHFNRTKPHFVA